MAPRADDQGKDDVAADRAEWGPALLTWGSWMDSYIRAGVWSPPRKRAVAAPPGGAGRRRRVALVKRGSRRAARSPCRSRSCRDHRGPGSAQGIRAGQTRPWRVGREELTYLSLLHVLEHRRSARPTSRLYDRSPAGSWADCPARSAPASRRSSCRSLGSLAVRASRARCRDQQHRHGRLRPRAACTIASARSAERSIDCSSAGACWASTDAAGASDMPLAGQRGLSAATIRRWIATARSYSISCSQIAHTSASNGSAGRRRAFRGSARTARPISGSKRKRSWNGRGRGQPRAPPHPRDPDSAPAGPARAPRAGRDRHSAPRPGPAPASRRDAAAGAAHRRGLA